MDDYTSIVQQWDKAKTLPVRERIKAFRTLGWQAAKLFHDAGESLEADQVLCLSKILADMISIHSFGNDYAVIRNNMLAVYFKKIGGKEPFVLLRQRIFKDHSQGVICIADATKELNAYLPDDEFIKSMNHQEAFYFTADDTTVEVNIVDFPEPILPLNDLKHVIASTFESGVISCTSGQLRISDYYDANEDTILTVKPGYYKVAAYLIKKRSTYYCIIAACETQKPFPTKTKVESLNDYG
ncbi:MAG: hypothetical protein JSR85_02690 [Proteobacteria bacterium]|nr:hypothetical protein [Pseudomonadota bacterium]